MKIGVLVGLVVAAFANVMAQAATERKIENQAKKASEGVVLIEAVVPLTSKKKAERLERAFTLMGVQAELSKELASYMLSGNADSRIMLLPLDNPKACVAVVAKHEALDVGRFAKRRPEGFEDALIAFLAEHEKAHCSGFVVSLPAGRMPTDAESWLEEARSDLAAREAMRSRGRAGEAVADAWLTRRLFDFLSADEYHWTTPWVKAAERSPMGTRSLPSPSGQAAAALSEAAMQLRKELINALFADSETSGKGQETAWDAAKNSAPDELSKWIPSLPEVREAAKAAWPDAQDWRLPTSGRTFAPRPRKP